MDKALVLSARQVVEPVSHRTVAAQEFVALELLQLADQTDAVTLQRGGEGFADAPDHGHRLFGEKADRLLLADHGETTRLAEVGGDLGEEFAVGEPGRNADADVLLDGAGEVGKHHGRRPPMQALGAREVQERLVDRQGFNQRRQRLHHRADFTADADILLHVRRNDDRLGAGRQRLEHRHRRAHALDAGDVAGGGDDTPLAAADDHRLVAEFRIIPLLDGGVKSVAVDVRQMEPVKLRMPCKARTAAMFATRRGAQLKRHAVAAEAVLRIVESDRHHAEHKKNRLHVMPPRVREQGRLRTPK